MIKVRFPVNEVMSTHPNKKQKLIYYIYLEGSLLRYYIFQFICYDIIFSVCITVKVYNNHHCSIICYFLICLRYFQSCGGNKKV